MTYYWIYDLPNWLFGLLTIVVFVVFSLLAVIVTRKPIYRLMGRDGSKNDVVSIYISAVGVFYGLIVGLIAVGTWENFNAVESKVSSEASAIAAVYSMVSSLPEKPKVELQAALKEYTRYTIEDAWPVQRSGVIPKGGTERLAHFSDILLNWEPQTETHKILLGSILEHHNDIIQIRRQRLQSVPFGLPSTVWTVVLLGAFLNIALTLFIVTEKIGFHLWMTAIFAAFVGLLIFLTAAMDNPFRGEFSVSSEAFQLVYDKYMK
jgi:hypothetical protein